jgi:hypothetical protein
MYQHVNYVHVKHQQCLYTNNAHMQQKCYHVPPKTFLWTTVPWSLGAGNGVKKLTQHLKEPTVPLPAACSSLNSFKSCPVLLCAVRHLVYMRLHNFSLDSITNVSVNKLPTVTCSPTPIRPINKYRLLTLPSLLFMTMHISSLLTWNAETSPTRKRRK